MTVDDVREASRNEGDCGQAGMVQQGCHARGQTVKKLWYDTFPIGTLGIAEDDVGVSNVFFQTNAPMMKAEECRSPLLERAAAELSEYLEGRRETFRLPLSLRGTPFQRSVWQALLEIPYGQTRSYRDIAIMVGHPNAARAVGMACHRNPMLILIPCHRVLGKSGSLVGYAGGLEVKQRLLSLEQRAPFKE